MGDTKKKKPYGNWLLEAGDFDNDKCSPEYRHSWEPKSTERVSVVNIYWVLLSLEGLCYGLQVVLTQEEHYWP